MDYLTRQPPRIWPIARGIVCGVTLHIGSEAGHACEHMFVREHETPSIIHADADAFFASVEQRDDPKLRGVPLVVGKGVVMAASYEARRHGIHGGMGGGRARRLCPGLVAVSPRFDAYIEASRQLFEVFRHHAPVVEGLSMEEAFLDVGGLERILGSPAEIARRLRAEARAEVGLAVTVGVARTKTLAKMASRAAKPDGVLVVATDRERAFIEPLPVESLWGVGPSTARALHELGVRTVGEITEMPASALATAVGRHAAEHLHNVALCRDARRVRAGRSRRSIGSQTAFPGGSKTPPDVILAEVVDRVTRRMRKSRRIGRTVILRLRFGDFKRATRSRTLRRATSAHATILLAAQALLDEAGPTISNRGLTLVGIAVTNLEPSGTGEQLELWAQRRAERLDAAIDDLRERFGNAVIARTPHLGREARSPFQ
jgi:DNA polymerase-4